MHTTKKNDDYPFITQNEAHLETRFKWIIILGALNHMISYRMAFDTYYVVIAPCNIYLGDDNIIKTITIGFVGIEVMIKNKFKKFVSRVSFMWLICKQICFYGTSCCQMG